MLNTEIPMAPSSFDPWSSEFIANPFPIYRELREQYPVCYFKPTDQWLISRYDHVNALLRDHRRFVCSYTHLASHEEMGRTPRPDWQEPFWRLNYGSLQSEPPLHTQLRQILNPYFSGREAQRLQPRYQKLVDKLIDDFVDSGSGDLVADVTEPLAFAIIGDIVGIPPADRRMVRAWTDLIMELFIPNHTAGGAERAVRASVEFDAYLRELMAECVVRPDVSLLSDLMAAHARAEIFHQEIACSAAMLLVGGPHSFKESIAMGCLALLHHPDQWELLRHHPELMPSAIEELLRYDTPIHMFERFVLADIKVDGVRIPRGAEVALLFASANHDPAQFADPERLDITRTNNRHLALGAGIHFCIGAHLARHEMAAMYSTLLHKAPHMRLLAEPQWGPGYNLRGPLSLHVAV
jgi:cytochrome P450